MSDIPTAVVLHYLDLALGKMCEHLQALGDELVNRRPALEGANSAYAIVTHCCGVMSFWGGVEVAGRPVERARAAEFTATGAVADLVAQVRATRAQFGRDLDGVDLGEAAFGARRRDGFTEPERAGVATKAGVLMHIYEEVAQHLGHLDLTVDLVRSGN